MVANNENMSWRCEIIIKMPLLILNDLDYVGFFNNFLHAVVEDIKLLVKLTQIKGIRPFHGLCKHL